MIFKMRNHSQNDNDIYFLEVVSNKIVVNNNYDGIQIFDNDLKLISKVNILDELTIYSSFNNYENEEILLFCPENEFIVYIDLNTCDYKIIYLKDDLKNVVFSSIYSWSGNNIILSTYKGEFYNVSIEENTIKLLDCNEVDKLYPTLYKFYQRLSQYKVINIHQNEYIAIIQDENNDIAVFNYYDQTKQNLKMLVSKFVNIEFIGRTFAVVNEEEIKVETDYNEESLIPNEKFTFLRARFFWNMNDIFLVTLSSSKSNDNHSNIDIYKLSK
ncbi:hypothetical protein [Gorillibacterium sp. CAU 1737]|uniref:hypothetical protein n=1 Tax=Gorillibacterium sp. CAU 1737 TaxID=3140362 RepID=UPI003260D7FF